MASSSCPTDRPSDLTRASLILRLKADDPAREIAWTEFHSIYAPIIAAFARRFGAKASDVDDVVQEVLQGFFKVSPEFVYEPAKGRFRGYLRTCVCHKIGRIREKAGRLPMSGRDVGDLDAPASEQVWNDLWETQKLHRALAAVRQQYDNAVDRRKTFQAFEMCSVLGRSTADVAASLDLSNESVRAAKSRVGRAVRAAFDSLSNED